MVGSDSGRIDLEWEGPEDDGGASLTGYYVYYKLSSDVSFTQSSLISPTQLTYSLLALTSDQPYSLKLTAANIKGESIPSPLLYQYSSAVPSSLTAPVIIPSTRTSTSLSVEWAVPGVSTTSMLGY